MDLYFDRIANYPYLHKIKRPEDHLNVITVSLQNRQAYGQTNLPATHADTYCHLGSGRFS
ncbi:hypothetical protein DSUL_20579 [Desulfovibrionales bacterium]